MKIIDLVKKQMLHPGHLRSWPSEEVTCFFSLHPGSILSVHARHPRGALHAHWACKMFSGLRD
jgi:hypothetical protein